MNKTVFALMTLSVLLVACVAMPMGDSDATSGFTITDGTGKEFHYTSAAERVVVQGTGTALTIADAGELDKIVAVDKYSTYDYTKYEQLRGMNANVKDLGSFYGSSNHENIATELVNMVDRGELSKDDTLILTSYTSNLDLREKLMSSTYGFTKVLIWLSSDVTEYADIVDFVESVSKIVTGTTPDSVTDMKKKVSNVEALVEAEDSSPKALYAWYYSKALQVGNKGLMASMLDLCGADNIGLKTDNSAERYGDVNTIIQLVGDNRDAVVFVSDSYFKTGKTVNDLRNEVFNGDQSIRIIQMGLDWNNWCPESADGLTEMAKALYDKDPAEYADSPGTTDNTMIIAIIAVVAVVCIAGVVFITRRP